MALVYADSIQIELRLASGGMFDPDIFDDEIFDIWEGAAPLDLDLREDAIVCSYGIPGSDPASRIAPAGSLAWSLDNSQYNQAQILGYYSPRNPAKRDGFDFDVETRFVITYQGQAYYKFRGRLDQIDATPGTYDERITRCKALDWMDDAARIDLPDLPAQIDQRDDEILATIFAAMSTPPHVTDIETGLDVYPIALDGGAVKGRRPKVREVLNALALSGFNYGYMKGDQVEGGTFKWENRHHRAANPDVLFTLDNTMARDGFVVPGARGDVVKRVQVYDRPTRTDPDPTTVLFALQTTKTLIGPGETNTSLFGPYRDPATNDPCGGTAMQTPDAGEGDYAMNAADDGSGADLTGDFTVAAAFTGIGVRFSITNTGSTPGYVTTLQVRGKGIYRSTVLIEVENASTYGDRVLTLDQPYQSDVNVGLDLATYLAQLLADPFTQVKAVTFLANTSAAFMEAALAREPGDRIAISEAVLGLDLDEFTINSVRLQVDPTGVIWCTWGLEPASAQRYWLWGVPGASEWGESTYYGF